MKLSVATFLFFFKAAVPESLGAGLKDKTSVQKSELAGTCNSKGIHKDRVDLIFSIQGIGETIEWEPWAVL